MPCKSSSGSLPRETPRESPEKPTARSADRRRSAADRDRSARTIHTAACWPPATSSERLEGLHEAAPETTRPVVAAPGRFLRRVTAQWSGSMPCPGRPPALPARHHPGGAPGERRRPRPRDRGPCRRALRLGGADGPGGPGRVGAHWPKGRERRELSSSSPNSRSVHGGVGARCGPPSWRGRWGCRAGPSGGHASTPRAPALSAIGPFPIQRRAATAAAPRVYLELAFVRTRQLIQRVAASREEKASRAECRREARRRAKEASRVVTPATAAEASTITNALVRREELTSPAAGQLWEMLHRLPARSGAGRPRAPALASTDVCRFGERCSQASARIMSDARSAIIMTGAWMLPEVIDGITDASATRRPSTPRTRRRGSTTAPSSLPMRHVPHGW